MADEIDAGAAYLAALKRSMSPRSAAAPAPARAPEGPRSSATPGVNAVPSSPASPNGAEKRRSPRYRCQGSARLQPVGSEATTWATFTDISMHGCYVEAPTPHRIGAKLSLRLEASGFRIEATGEVRVAYPGLGMGISFDKMSEENRERLCELARSISRPSMILSSRSTPRPPAVPQPEMLRAVANPAAALQAIFTFFEDRHMMGREEFLRIVRKSQ
jgi:hypothetical protein